ncbi:MAG: Asp-tRNA(Asn)/Glu-tRNA(Gln) amidotransferase subunit GatC [Anaerolineae bacterium]|nr:Asp-tRNA(Asn)/Glu-tRNA(Gln) amidotransferase subunit GatC [Anaerolineae bacterium]
MALTREIVENIAELAKLALSEEEIDLYREQLSEILDYVDRLAAVDTDDIAPTASTLPIINALRVDVVQPCLSTAEALAAAPRQEANQFSVEAVLEGEA